MNSNPVASPVSGPIATTPETRRVLSIDALRGFDMFWILGADALMGALKKMAEGSTGPAASAATFLGDQLDHVEWEGFHFYDLIFPLFVFIVGVSIVFSVGKTVEREGKAAAHGRIFRRFALLFVIAILYYGGFANEWPKIRLVGVLQRIAFCYLFAALLFVHLRLRGLIVACVALLVGYWALMTFVPVPGIGAGSFAMGANLANWIDAHYLPGKLWDGTWDPEGLLSTLPAIATCLLGIFAGLLLKSTKVEEQRKVFWLIGSGVVAVVLGFLWGLQFPVIKKIWTSSYVLVAGGFSAILLGCFHQIVDVWKYQKWATPFVWIGANAITLYLVENVVGFDKLAARFAGGDIKNFLDAHVAIGCGALVISIVALLLAIWLAAFLYRRKIFLRV